MTPREERRLQILYLDPRMLLDLLTGKCIAAYDLPDDVQYVNADYNFERQCFAVCIASVTFDVCAPGAEIRRWVGWERVESAPVALFTCKVDSIEFERLLKEMPMERGKMVVLCQDCGRPRGSEHRVGCRLAGLVPRDDASESITRPAEGGR